MHHNKCTTKLHFCYYEEKWDFFSSLALFSDVWVCQNNSGFLPYWSRGCCCNEPSSHLLQELLINVSLPQTDPVGFSYNFYSSVNSALCVLIQIVLIVSVQVQFYALYSTMCNQQGSCYDFLPPILSSEISKQLNCLRCIRIINLND